MARPRYRAAVLDGLTIVLDLIGDEYVAVPQDPAMTGNRAQEVASCLGTPATEIRFIDRHDIKRAGRGLDGEVTQPVRVRLLDWLRLAGALPTAMWSLRFGRPSTWIENEGTSMPAATPETIVAACQFRAMRPFVPWLSRCLPHALLLCSYLRAGGHQSMLVIGVRLFPFEAHSWVQAGDVVLTDDLDLVAAYSVIAAG